MLKIRGFRRIFMVCCFAMLCIPNAKAITVSPLTLELTNAGPQSKATLRVKNDSASPVPIEILVSQIEITKGGALKQKSADGEFLIFPPQATIPPGGSQAFRIQWMSKSDLKASQTYVFSVNQLPVAFEASKSGLQIVLNFSVLVNVAPVGSKPDVSLVAFELSNQRYPSLLVENRGKRHALLTEGTVTLEGAGWKKTYAGADLLQALGGMGLVQPGQQRQFVFKTPLPSNASSITAAAVNLTGAQ